MRVKHFVTLMGLMFGLLIMKAQVRIVSVDPLDDQISLKNVGDAEADISDYFFCLGPGQYNALSDYSNVDGDLSLAPDETVTFDLTSGSQNVTALPDDEAALALFAIGGNFGSSVSSVWKLSS